MTKTTETNQNTVTQSPSSNRKRNRKIRDKKKKNTPPAGPQNPKLCGQPQRAQHHNINIITSKLSRMARYIILSTNAHIDDGSPWPEMVITFQLKVSNLNLFLHFILAQRLQSPLDYIDLTNGSGHSFRQEGGAFGLMRSKQTYQTEAGGKCRHDRSALQLLSFYRRFEAVATTHEDSLNSKVTTPSKRTEKKKG